MTEQEVLERIASIRDKQSDDEAAHSREDELREDVLQAIADGADNAQALAKLALTTNDIVFCRWYA